MPNNWVQAWRQGHPLFLLLLPLSWLFCAIVKLRRWAYQSKLLRSYQSNIPIIVVGNISVGGTGKTPMVMYLVEQLSAQGYQVGIVSRGYQAKINTFPHQIQTTDTAEQVGDEPLLLAQKTGCPVVIAPQRVDAVKTLESRCDVILSDDGLQHYAMQRDIEIVLLDQYHQQQRHCLPAGCLREPKSRLQQVDFVFSLHYKIKQLQHLQSGDTKSIHDFKGKTVHALAGIASPNNFFKLLQQHSIQVIKHPFADHHAYQARDFVFNDDHPLLITEKDAVKCQTLPLDKVWVVVVEAQIDETFLPALQQKLRKTHDR